LALRGAGGRLCGRCGWLPMDEAAPLHRHPGPLRGVRASHVALVHVVTGYALASGNQLCARPTPLPTLVAF
jgi:hypothetical protein